MAPLRLGTHVTERFVKLYIQCPCLWDKHDPNHRNREYRDRCIHEIASQMGLEDFGPNECRYKIRNIRSHYLQEIKKIRDAEEKGEDYVPTLKWFSIVDNAFRESEVGLIIRKYSPQK